MRILFVDNHPEFTATVIECFLREHDVVVVTTIAAAKEHFQASEFDVVLVDYDLDDGKGDEFVRWLRSRDANAKIIAVSAREVGNEALVAAGANIECPKSCFARIQTLLKERVLATAATSRSSEGGSGFHHDLLAALQVERGLILVAGPTGHGKTTAIEKVLADPACPPNVLFVGDLRGDLDAARHAVSASRSRVVVAVLRIPRAAGSFRRFVDMQVPADAVAEVSLQAFSTRLIRPSGEDARQEFLLLHERIVVTDSIRTLVNTGADEDAIHRRAIAEGMRSLRHEALDQVRVGRLVSEAVATLPPDE
jgi:CheY-like chemotaxis protein